MGIILHEKEFYNLMSQENYFEYLVRKYPWATDYCYYYVYVVCAVRESIEGALCSIVEEDQSTFEPLKAYKYLSLYEKKRLGFVTIIPTCNRPEAIENILIIAAARYRRLCADIIIYDSSTSDDTQKVVERFYNNGFYNVKYKRYTGVFDGFSLDHKVMEAYRDFMNEYDYLWLCRDGLVPVIEEIIAKIRYYKEKEIGCIIVDTKSRNNWLEIEKKYLGRNDCGVFLKEQADRLQTLGMLILSGTYAKKLLEKVPLSEKTYSLWQMCAPFHDFLDNKNGVVFITRNVFEYNAKASVSHFWSKAEKHFEQWARRWCLVIDGMPEEYEETKNECRMVYTVDFHPFSSGKILKMRAEGGLSIGIINKYREYLRCVTKTPIWYFYLIALTPVFLAKIIKYIAYANFAKAKNVANTYIDKMN